MARRLLFDGGLVEIGQIPLESSPPPPPPSNIKLRIQGQLKVKGQVIVKSASI